MTALQTSAAEYAITLTTQLRHELARLLTIPAPQCDDAAIAMRGAEMTADALLRLLPLGKVVEVNDDGTVTIDVEPIVLPRIIISPKTTHCVIESDDAETLLP